MQQSLAKPWVVFDLDGTLIRGNSFRWWWVFAVWRWPWRLPVLVYILGLRRLGLISHQQLKQRILAWPSPPAHEVQRFVGWLLKRINPSVQAALQKALQNPEVQVAINTAAPAFYTQPLAQRLGVPWVLATPPLGAGWQDNRGVHKIEAMRQALGPFELQTLYTDHHDDLPLMRLAQQVVLVNPSPKTLQRVKEAGIMAQVSS